MTAFVVDLDLRAAAPTVEQYRKVLAAFVEHVADIDEHATVADLHRDWLVSFFRSTEQGRHDKARAPVTRRRMIEKVEAAWRWLFDTDYHPSVPKPRTLELPHEVASPVVSPTFDEMGACVRACVSEGPRRLTTLLYYLGVRVEQAAALRPADFDFERGLVKIPPQKGLPGRTVPMNHHLVAEMRTWDLTGATVVGWVVSRQRRDRVLAEAWERAGVREEVWRGPRRGQQAHAFRRGFTTALKLLGADVEDTELYVGRQPVGSRKSYLDLSVMERPWRAVVALIPQIGGGA